ncbi:hypothetical protein EVJ50_10890 [Synechococcus sp. RSCCF101]|uniref:hypothetical protein n=1 Tax=Synechococcus sp. RSCCF101 TaxID=2511069 RepID=UPI001244DAD3|nr:hypothetical protein [Synechococcus sp. RSCCF101]QEY32654.1 hypothetical protein EVJ50_10890 [Synechococcus sp. RSCCF101]
MPQIPCCRSCRHCTLARSPEPGFCNLRQLPIHAEVAGDVSCHHWTPRGPRLPMLPDREALSQALPLAPLQLDLESAFAST